MSSLQEQKELLEEDIESTEEGNEEQINKLDKLRGQVIAPILDRAKRTDFKVAAKLMSEQDISYHAHTMDLSIDDPEIKEKIAAARSDIVAILDEDGEDIDLYHILDAGTFQQGFMAWRCTDTLKHYQIRTLRVLMQPTDIHFHQWKFPEFI